MTLQLKPANQINLENTKTNRAANQVEKAMQIALNRIANNVKTKYADLPLNVLLSPEMLVADEGINNITRDTIRASVQEFYLLGATYINDAYRLNLIITERDAANIKSISTEVQARFYYNVISWLNREKQIIQLEMANLPLQNDHLDIEAAIERLTVTASTRGINHGTVDKVLQLRDQPSILTRSAARPTLNKAGVKQIELNLFEKPTVGPIMQWVTDNDDKVCDLCESFSDMTFDLGAQFDIATQDMPIPPDETHPNCRCRLLLVDPHIDYRTESKDIVNDLVFG